MEDGVPQDWQAGGVGERIKGPLLRVCSIARWLPRAVPIGIPGGRGRHPLRPFSPTFTAVADAERTVLMAIADTPEPIDTPMTCARLAGIGPTDARIALESLAGSRLIDWTPAERDEGGSVTTRAHWEITAQGRRALVEQA